MKKRFTKLPPFPEIRCSVDRYYPSVYSEIPNPPRREIYCSTPLNSGRMLDLITQRVNHLPLKQRLVKVFELNYQIARRVASELAEVFPEQRLTLAGCIEQNNNWGHSDLTRFWAYYIAGLDPVLVAQFESMVKNAPIMVQITSAKPTGEKSDREIRKEAHKQFLVSFDQFLANRKNGLNPVSTVILLPGHQKSLGCCFEKQLAQSLGIPLKEAVFDENNTRYAGFMSNLLKGLYIDELGYQAVKEGLGSGIWFPTFKGNGERLVCLKDLVEVS